MKVKVLVILISILIPIFGFCGNFSVEQNLQDFDSVVYNIEDGYAGFELKTKGENLDKYNTLKAKLRDDILNNKREGHDAASELIAWFNDFHLRSSNNSYVKFPIDYRSIYKEYKPNQIAIKVTNKTFLIRCPTFRDRIKDFVAKAIIEYNNSGCENLIIDIRGNGGGTDSMYDPILRLLYDKQGKTDAAEVRNSESTKRNINALSKAENIWAKKLYAALSSSKKEYVLFPFKDTVSVISQDLIGRFPLKAGVIIDRAVASSGEQFVIDVKACSDRTTIYGKENTLGCIDISNLIAYNMPNSGLTYYIPISRSLRVKNNRVIDGIGIQPDVRINLDYPTILTDNIDTWTQFIASELEK